MCIIIEKTVLAFMKNALQRLLLLYEAVEYIYDDVVLVVGVDVVAVAVAIFYSLFGLWMNFCIIFSIFLPPQSTDID